MSKLAIVIPAYKDTYFDQALFSIADQTNKDFTLYIGDDLGSETIYKTVKKYEARIPINYTRFSNNLGGTDLVAQWERCIDLINDEEWIWLFSDDDRIEPTCVQNFYRALEKSPETDLFHFDVLHIDESDNIIGDLVAFPENMRIEDLLRCRLNNQINSTVVEYVFRRSRFFALGRFQNFDLAWGSDDATWIKLGKAHGIKTVPDSKVLWRQSPFNISPNYKDKNILYRKYCSQLDFASWILKEKKYIDIEINLLRHLLKMWFVRSLRLRAENLTQRGFSNILIRYYEVFEVKHYSRPFEMISIYYYRIFRSMKSKLKKLLLKSEQKATS
jgi:hypothetical protein